MASVERPGFSKTTLRRYYNDGGRFALLAGGGMYYWSSIISDIVAYLENLGTMLLLAVLAISKIKTGFHIRETMEDVLIKINHTLRCPEPGEQDTKTFPSFLLTHLYRKCSGKTRYKSDNSCHLIYKRKIQNQIFDNAFFKFNYWI